MKTLLFTLAIVATAGLSQAASLRGGRQLASTASDPPVGYWDCWTSNGVARQSITYGFSSTKGSTKTQTTRESASLSVSQSISYGEGPVKGKTGIKLEGSIANSNGISLRQSETSSDSTTVSAVCPAQLCPSTGPLKLANICQWKISGSDFTFAGKTILFAPVGKAPKCPTHPDRFGTYCDTEHDAWCSRCTVVACAEAPDLPGCAWFDVETYKLGSGENLRTFLRSRADENKEYPTVFLGTTMDNPEYIRWSTADKRWELGLVGHAATNYLDGPNAEYPPIGTFKFITDGSDKKYSFFAGVCPIGETCEDNVYTQATNTPTWKGLHSNLPCNGQELCDPALTSEAFKPVVYMSMLEDGNGNWIGYKSNVAFANNHYSGYFAGNNNMILAMMVAPNTGSAFPPTGVWQRPPTPFWKQNAARSKQRYGQLEVNLHENEWRHGGGYILKSQEVTQPAVDEGLFVHKGDKLVAYDGGY